ncbi:MAG: hypothetical protein JNL01_16755 [Bdellovibrionales bacterium]|nr:hypothetical protein [Bdellovibrionales bacterium]
MKSFVLIFLVVIATQMGLTQAGPVNATLSHDGLPYDGTLVEFKFEFDTVLKLYNLVQYETFYDRVQGKKVTQGPVTVWEGLDCLITPQSIYCSADDRPSDGVLVEYTIASDGAGTYRLDEKTTAWSRQLDKEVVQSRVVGEYLNLSTY